MRLPVLPAAALFCIASSPALCQTAPPADPSTQPHKTWELGRRAANSLTKQDGGIDDPRILPYVQQLADRMSSAAGAAAVRIQLTRTGKQYAALLPNRELVLSGGLLLRMEDEATLAGLIAHELAHDHVCVLDPLRAEPVSPALRDHEYHATTLAIVTLKAAGYDPTSLLGLLSKLAYEHPEWAKAIVPEDLQQLRMQLENDAEPPGGYRLDSSDFVKAHSALVSMLPNIEAPALRPVLRDTRQK